VYWLKVVQWSKDVDCMAGRGFEDFVKKGMMFVCFIFCLSWCTSLYGAWHDTLHLHRPVFEAGFTTTNAKKYSHWLEHWPERFPSSHLYVSCQNASSIGLHHDGVRLQLCSLSRPWALKKHFPDKIKHEHNSQFQKVWKVLSKNGSKRCRGWLRHCATNRKVTGSIPDCVTGIFHWRNPFGLTITLGSTQPLTEMSTRYICWG
jgi:hypothetical protein